MPSTRSATKGERTRDRIVAAAAPLFNQRGYVGASLADLMAATGLEKGGIYRHFESKDALALAAFDHAVALHRRRLVARVAATTGAVARLTALVDAMAGVADDPAVPGGCPLLNTAIETDDGAGSSHAELRKRTRLAMRRLLGYVRRLIERGVADGELDPAVDAALEAAMLVATMEGALMLAKLYDDPRYVTQAATRLARQAAAMAATARPAAF
ncbi:MAG: TetR/AcrR family transcriptional regulator [Gemmatirosa sp.]|nr:TetR/AcrR family transcriptional regulator [Gemmatirosa sp.]